MEVKSILDFKHLGKWKYEVETRYFDDINMCITPWDKHIRYYEVEQDVNNFPDNKMRRNFKDIN